MRTDGESAALQGGASPLGALILFRLPTPVQSEDGTGQAALFAHQWLQHVLGALQPLGLIEMEQVPSLETST